MAGNAKDARNKVKDLSGLVLQPGENHYAAFIGACSDKSHEIQQLYDAHRTRRNQQQRELFLSPNFDGVKIDQHLLRLERPSIQPGFRDQRHCLTFWARPPIHLLALAARIQDMLAQAAPNVWFMPTYRMHLTTLEVDFCKTPDEIASLVSALRPALPTLASYTHTHRARLVKPLISYDLSAFALSFLPASHEPLLSPLADDSDAQQGVIQGDSYTYHHLRRDMFDQVRSAHVDINSRYQVPSAHITLGRYLDQSDHDTTEKRHKWIDTIHRINTWLQTEIWDKPGAEFIGEWVVGHEKGLDVRCGTLWYGGGRTIMMGEGF
ncbi:hypothetical protein CDD81_7124 [Ophiocordyceps australis]|uniref:Uncharacterized protein n=1 Tax=Ophiocordyceps australis TaxID=1399860 RepID=A0A2C5Y1B3_9HYPO|nr:hypothetical protein CDD81_7124 [Ophiocordyceps australis]